MPDQVRLAWQEKRIAQEVMLPLVRIRTPKADRVFGFVYPGVGEILSGGFFEEEAFFDEELFFDEGGVVLDEGARLLEISPIEESHRSFDTAILGSFGQAERSLVIVRFDNSDQALSQWVGEEYLLNAEAYLYFTFPGLVVTDSYVKRTGRVRRWVLSKDVLTLEIETQ